MNLYIQKTQETDQTTLLLTGSLDTTTSPQLKAELESVMAGTKGSIVLEFSGLDYISSAGLRVLLAVEKKCRAEGRKQIIRGLSDAMREVFDITGFLDILTIE